MNHLINRLLYGNPMGGIVLGLIGFFFMGGGNHSYAGQFAYSGNVVIEGIPYTGSLEMSFSMVDDQGTQHWRSGESADDRIEVMVERGRYLVILGGQGMSPIPPDLLLDQPELYVHMSFAKDGVAELQTIPGRRVLSSPRVLAAELADLADRAVLADSLADGSLTLDMLDPALQAKIARAMDPEKIDQVFVDYFGDKYGPKLSGGSSAEIKAVNGSSVTLSGVASGMAVTYQWKKNGEVIEGQNVSSLQVNAQSGESYTMLATNAFGTVEKTFSLSQPAPPVPPSLEPDTPIGPVFNPNKIIRNQFAICEHAMFIDANGSLWAFGKNNSARLGTGDDITRSSPVKIMEGGVAAMVLQTNASYFIKEDGSLWSMGHNHYGRTGHPSINTTVKTPTQVIESGVYQVAAGQWHHLVLKFDGSLWAMGRNNAGQLGDGTTQDRHSYIKIVDSGVVRIAANNVQSFYIMDNGSLWAMGNNSHGRLGNGLSYEVQSTPIQIVESGVVDVSAGFAHTAFVKSDGSAWAMGQNGGDGRLGNNKTVEERSPVKIFDSGISRVYASAQNSFFLKTDGTLWGCGDRQRRQLGSMTSTVFRSPIEIAQNVVDASSQSHTLFFQKTDGNLYGLGLNNVHQFADGNVSYTHLPYTVEEANVTAVSAGWHHNLYVKKDGSLWGMGRGNDYVFTTGWRPDSIPVKIMDENVTLASAGERHTLFLTSDGSLWGLGKRHDGRLGQNASSGHNSTPHQIVNGNVTDCSAGYTHSLFVKSDGSLWGMGSNHKGQLGDGTNQSRLNPIQIVDEKVTMASAGYNFSVFLKTDGSVWSMGSNYSGKLGYGGLTDQNIPVLVMASGAKDISAGPEHGTIVKEDGSLWVFGGKWLGRLGEYEKFDRYTPLQVIDSGVVSASAGKENTLFVKIDGSLWGMGNNNHGQLMIDPAVSNKKNRPWKILDGGVKAVESGDKHTLLLMEDGSMLTFGRDDWGQLGSGRMVWSAEPVLIKAGLPTE
jgi:alpha-tubulin suppressor-like RCC1 family protein